MIGTMNPSLRRLAAVGAALVLIAVLAAAGNRSRLARAGDKPLTPAVRAQGLTFAPEVAPADRAWVLAAIAAARPEAQRLIDAVDGLVTIRVVNKPDAPFVGFADPASNDITLNVAYLDGDRAQDRNVSVLHELGHIVDFLIVPDEQIARMAAQIPVTGGCVTAERGDCTVPEERFADTFAKWALRGSVSRAGAGYSIATPVSLETWGAPLGLLAIQVWTEK
jgi:hypothetical protein